ncbi:MAG TPA: hypothetical protein PKC43_01815 [Phycisphaerales bacterium]|nr:hypothetical protein [Phycisphaerales bacterium]HMP36162.1 hypothetical protein [Phycisphaerales bacterium]
MPTAERIRRIAWPWRVTLVVYAALLTLGTHWPRLALGTESLRVSDKLLHMAAFGGLTFLLWQAWIIRRPALLLAVGAAWAALDELTQGIPGLGRTISGLDVIASVAGVFLVAAGVWATGPLGGARSRLARSRLLWAWEEALAPPASVGMLAAGAAAGAALGVVGGWIVFRVPRVDRPADGAVVGALIGAAAGAHLTAEFLRWRLLRAPHRRCFECGVSADEDDVLLRRTGSAPCSGCGAMLWLAQWDALPRLRLLTPARIILMAIAGTMVIIAATFGVSLALLGLRLRVPSLGDIDGAYRSLGFDMQLVIEVTWLAGLGALATRLVRRVLARSVDRGHLRCVACGHDLRSTPTEGGRGTCGECGALFAAVVTDSRGG